MERVEKKYSLGNSYYKLRKPSYPDKIGEILEYLKEYKELPFEYSGNNWAYDAFCERQKQYGVRNSQYMTPDKLSEQMVELTNNFLPKDNRVLNACCGIGQLVKYLQEHKLKVTGFDMDEDLVDFCKEVYPDGIFYTYDYIDKKETEKWDLIVANPPLDKAYLLKFTSWILTALTPEGRAVLLMPKDYVDKTFPSELCKILQNLKILYREKACEESVHNKFEHEICIVALSEEYISTGRTVQKNESTHSFKSTPDKNDKLLELDNIERIERISLDKIRPNPFNPRKRIKQEEIISLSQCIKAKGLIHSIILRRITGDTYEIVCGERRWRAFQLLGESKIPSVIRDFTDEQALELAIAENAARENLSVMEEVNAYQLLQNNGKWSIEDIALKFGQKETYIKNRLRLLSLIPDIQNLIDDDEVKVSVGLELTKYPKEIQERVYKEHFVNDDSTCWMYLSVKDFSSRMERNYTNDLSKVLFDKTECNTCPLNTGTYNLFGEQGNSRCTNTECLERKKKEYTFNLCKAQIKHDPTVEICIKPYDCIDENLNKELKQTGIEINAVAIEEFPVAPKKPDKNNFHNEENWTKAHDAYLASDHDYAEKMEAICEKIESGDLKKVLYVGDATPRYCLALVDKTKNSDPVKELKAQDKKNKETALTHIFADCLALLKTKNIPTTKLTMFEDELFLFILLSYLDKKDYPLFGIKDTKKTFLTDSDKELIIKEMTSDLRAILVRRFIIKYFSSSNINISPKSKVLLPQMAIQFFPGETQNIVSKYTNIYQKSNEVIQAKIKKLKEKEHAELTI